MKNSLKILIKQTKKISAFFSLSVIYYTIVLIVFWKMLTFPYENISISLTFILLLSVPITIIGSIDIRNYVAIELMVTVLLLSFFYLFWDFDPALCLKYSDDFYQNVFSKRKDLVLKSYDYLLNLCTFFSALYLPYLVSWVFLCKRYFSKKNIKEHGHKNCCTRYCKNSIRSTSLSLSILCNIVSMGATYHLVVGGVFLLNSGKCFDYYCMNGLIECQFYLFLFAIFFLCINYFFDESQYNSIYGGNN